MKMIMVAVLLIGAAAVAIPQSASAERRTRYHECTPGGKCRYVSGGLRFRSPGVKISKRKQTQTPCQFVAFHRRPSAKGSDPILGRLALGGTKSQRCSSWA